MLSRSSYVAGEKLPIGFAAGKVATICEELALVTVRSTVPKRTVGDGVELRFVPEIVTAPGGVELVSTFCTSGICACSGEGVTKNTNSANSNVMLLNRFIQPPWKRVFFLHKRKMETNPLNNYLNYSGDMAPELNGISAMK
jgi:hypothetical protein